MGVEDVARLEDQRDHLGIGCIQRLPAQQADRLEFIGRLPAQAPVQQAAELAPAVEQPPAAGGGGFELEEQACGRVGVVAEPGVGDAGLAMGVVEGMGVERQGPHGVLEEPLTQRGGLVAFAAGRLENGVNLIIDAVDLARRLEGADLCLTCEGALDGQSAFGKTAVGVSRLARSLGCPTFALAGTIGPGAKAVLEESIDAYFSICPGPIGPDQAIARRRAVGRRDGAGDPGVPDWTAPGSAIDASPSQTFREPGTVKSTVTSRIKGNSANSP
jgi:hypothetical protein